MKSISKKSITFSIILLFIGVSISSAISVDTETTEIEDCGCNDVSDADIVILEKQLNRLDVYSKLLLVLSTHYPLLKESSEELSNEITIFKSRFEGLITDGDSVICDVLYRIFSLCQLGGIGLLILGNATIENGNYFLGVIIMSIGVSLLNCYDNTCDRYLKEGCPPVFNCNDF